MDNRYGERRGISDRVRTKKVLRLILERSAGCFCKEIDFSVHTTQLTKTMSNPLINLIQFPSFQMLC